MVVIRNNNSNINIDITIFLILSGALLLPTIPLSSIKIRVSEIIALFLLPMLSLSFAKTKKIDSLYLLFIIFFCMITSTLFGYLFLSVPVDIRDINELARMLIPLLTFWVTINSDPHVVKRTINLFFKIGTPFIIIFSLLQHYLPFTIPVFLLNLYGGEHHVTTLLTESSQRIFATGSDPNVGGAIILLFLFYHASCYYEFKKFKNAFFSLAFLLLLSFTASRTVLIALFFVSFSFLFFSNSINWSFRIIIIIVLFAFAYLVWITVDYVRIGLLLFVNGENNSWLQRIENFEEARQLFLQSPFFGWGPAKAIHATVVDGEYFLLIRRYGIIGLLCVIIFLIKSSYSGFTYINNHNLHLNRVIPTTFTLYSLSIFIVMITNNFFSGYQLLLPYIILLGYLKRINMENRCLYVPINEVGE